MYLGACFSVDGKWTKHIKKRTEKVEAWRWKASNVARRHGAAPLGAEQHIRDAGERASGLYGAEAWVSMTGRRYEELSAKQWRMEREMLGMAKFRNFGEPVRKWGQGHGQSKNLCRNGTLSSP